MEGSTARADHNSERSARGKNGKRSERTAVAIEVAKRVGSGMLTGFTIAAGNWAFHALAARGRSGDVVPLRKVV